jgi:hypothetical protein
LADYSTAYYYQITAGGVLTGNGQYLASAEYTDYYGGYATGVEMHVPAQANVTYQLTSVHRLTASYVTWQLGYYCTWECNLPIDIYGYSYILGPSAEPEYVWFPPLIAIAGASVSTEGTTTEEFFGFVDCAKACSELAAAIDEVARRTGEILLDINQMGVPDPGHVRALQQAEVAMEKAYNKVAKYCGPYAGAALLLAAAIAAAEAAAAVAPIVILI